MNELLNCPFCGNEHMFYEKLDRYNWSIKCGNCSCRLAHFESKDLAADGWNTRADTDLLYRVKEAVAEIEEQKADVFSDDQNKMECDDIWMNIGERNAYKLCVATLYEYFPELEAQDDTD
jgi:transcription elongation factor Elf1